MASNFPIDESASELQPTSSDSVIGVDQAVDYIDKQFKTVDKNKRFVIVTAGKAGVGKSTLINNFLQLDDDAAFKTGFDPRSVTTTVDHRDTEIEGVQVRVIDMPGLHAADSGVKTDKRKHILGDLKALTGKGVDVVFYCISLLNRHEKVDFDNLGTMAKVFGQEIWEHIIFVFTYTDVVQLNSCDSNDLVEAHIKELRKYQIRVGKKKVNVQIRSTCSFSDEAELINFKGIVGIPVSNVPTIPKNWQKNLTDLVVLKCRKENVPAILKLRCMYIDWHEVKKVLKITAAGSGYGAAGGSAIGAGVGAIVGGVLTAPIGGTGALGTAAAGAAIGAWIGTISGTGIAGFSALCTRIVYVIHSRQNIIKKAQHKLEMKEKGEDPAPETSGASQDEAEL